MGDINTEVGAYRLFGAGDQSRWNAIEQWLDGGGSLADLAMISTTFPANGWTDLSLRKVITNDNVTLTPSVANGRGVVTAAGGSGNHREFFLNPDLQLEESEIRSVIYGGGTWADTANRTQQGHVHGAQILPNGMCRAYVAWHDMAAGLPTGINVGVWEGDGPIPNFTIRFSNAVVAIPPAVPMVVASASRTSNVVDLVVPGAQANGVRVGDRVDVNMSNSGMNITGGIVTLVFGELVRYNQTAADVTAANAGVGFLRRSSPLGEFPYVMASRWSGRTIQVKVWRINDPEPPTWQVSHIDTPDATAPMAPTGAGMPGVMVGHVEGTQAVEFGRVWVTGR